MFVFPHMEVEEKNGVRAFVAHAYFKLCPISRKCFLILGLIFLSGVRSILPTSSTLARLYLTQNN